MAAMQPNPEILGVSQHLRSRLRKVLVWPNPSLHQPCVNVTEFNEELEQLVMDMTWTMDINNGVGLAAPQVGVLKNIITLGIPYVYPIEGSSPTADPEESDPFKRHYVLINPTIIETSNDLMCYEEGCISVPGFFEKRKRPSRIKVVSKSPQGYTKEQEFSGLEAFVIQHEIDHLNGKLFIDNLSKLKKDRIKKKIKKIKG